MSEQLAKSTKHTSRRAKQPDQVERRTVFKSVLANPFQVQWPNVSPNVQNAILAQLVALLDGVAEYHINRQRNHQRKRKADESKISQSKRRRVTNPSSAPLSSGTEGISMDTMSVDASMHHQDDRETEPQTQSVPRPEILGHLSIGINEVTKKLESHTKSFRQIISTSTTSGETDALRPTDTVKAVFVCRADIDPPALISHLPQLVAACNSLASRADQSEPGDDVLLVPMAPGAEATLAEALGLRRVSVIAVHNTLPCLAELEALLQSVPVLNASWMIRPGTTASSRASLEPTHIKQLRTSAPKDMKAAKEQRTQRRAHAKEIRKGRTNKEPKSVTLKS